MDTYSPSYSINKTHIYHVSKHSSSHYGSLIDRGANGGLAGSDVRILERTGRTVSVTGIDNHELPGLDIVTCAALLQEPPVMTNPSMWEGNKLSPSLMDILLLSSVGHVSCI